MIPVPTITRKLEFDAGHRLLRHESKCANLHGHRYVAELSVMASELDKVGRVIDFSRVKDIVGSWIDEYWDHAFIFNCEDHILVDLFKDPKAGRHYIVPFEPTAENLSVYLANRAQELLRPHNIRVNMVRLYETPNCWADSLPGVV